MTKKLVVSDIKDLTTATMTQNNKKYKWCTSCNNGRGAWGFHWKDGHEEWKIKKGKKPSARFSNISTNAVIYCSYLMTTSEESIEEEAKGGDDSQNDDFISLSRFELLKCLLKRAFFPLLLRKGSSARSDIICYKCGKRGHIQKLSLSSEIQGHIDIIK